VSVDCCHQPGNAHTMNAWCDQSGSGVVVQGDLQPPELAVDGRVVEANPLRDAR